MGQYRNPGDECLFRGVIHGRVWAAQSVLVEKDAADETVLSLVPGAECAHPEGYWRWKKEDHSQGTRWQEAGRKAWKLCRFSWQTNRILTVLEPDKYYACCLFWDDATDEFKGYYVNFQLPFQRSRSGYDALDLDLDMVIAPDFTWQWKDEFDYQMGIADGGIRAEWVRSIEDAKSEVMDRLHSHDYPFDGSWLSWRPQTSRVPSVLPADWQNV
jgi:hypothetical protein